MDLVECSGSYIDPAEVIGVSAARRISGMNAPFVEADIAFRSGATLTVNGVDGIEKLREQLDQLAFKMMHCEPQAILCEHKMDPRQAKAFIDFFENRHKGPGAGRISVMPMIHDDHIRYIQGPPTALGHYFCVSEDRKNMFIMVSQLGDGGLLYQRWGQEHDDIHAGQISWHWPQSILIPIFPGMPNINPE